jgi:hypothetical protein
VDVTAL